MDQSIDKKSAVLDLLKKFQQFAVLNGNKGFYIKSFESFFGIPHDTNRLVKIAETGATHGKFLVLTANSLIFLDHLWALKHHLPQPSDDAFLHSGSKRNFLKKTTNLSGDAREGEILECWMEFARDRLDESIKTKHLINSFEEFQKKSGSSKKTSGPPEDESAQPSKPVKPVKDATRQPIKHIKPVKNVKDGSAQPVKPVKRKRDESEEEMENEPTLNEGEKVAERKISKKRKLSKATSKGTMEAKGLKSHIVESSSVTPSVTTSSSVTTSDDPGGGSIIEINDFLYSVPLQIDNYYSNGENGENPFKDYMSWVTGNLYIIKYPNARYSTWEEFQTAGIEYFKKGPHVHEFKRSCKYYKDHCIHRFWLSCYEKVARRLSSVDGNSDVIVDDKKLIRELIDWE